MTAPGRMIVFGATGAIGAAVVDHARQEGWRVVAQSRQSVAGHAEANGDSSEGKGVDWLCYDPVVNSGDEMAGQAPFDAVCFAQGANMADTVTDFDADRHVELYRANCLSVAIALSALSRRRLLSARGSRITVVSSIWQERARANKLSYTMTKAAIGGLVRSASVDLGAEGHMINAVLPGVLDTPMTRSNLSPAQIGRVEAMTPAGRLPDLATLAQTILFLCSPRNTSINGQSLTVDLGMTNAYLV